jgi:hypothetical protein
MINNVAVFDFFYRIKSFRHNRKLKLLAEKFSAIDSIMDYDKFVQETIAVMNLGMPLTYKFMGTESYHYGHFQSLLEYAGLKRNLKPSSIYIEHGTNFSVDDVPDDVIENSAIMIYQSDYKRINIRSKSQNMPVISIGPYVYYAKPYYNDEELQLIKRTFGKTLVIYTNHTYEDSEIKRDYNEYFEKLILPYEDVFDTILVCVYWHDVCDELYTHLSRHPKVKLVSAGVRFDHLFISRTKSIIQLADLVIGNDIGTYVGYAICLGKEVKYVACKDILRDRLSSSQTDMRMKYNKKRVIDALDSGDSAQIRSLYNEFWGGQHLRNPKEIMSIIQGAKDILKESHYHKKNFAASREVLLKRWSTKPECQLKYELLKAENGYI